MRTTLLSALLLIPLGCAGGGSGSGFRLFDSEEDARELGVTAVSDADPDVRREAAARLADSRAAREDWALDVLAAIAELDSDPHARCVAVRGLGRTETPQAVQACLRILNWRDHREDVREPGPLCRWDATLVLATAAREAWAPEEQRAPVRDTLIERLRNDGDRHVRGAAARGLGVFPEMPALEALIASLHDAEFAVVAACETSLVELTGVTHDHSARAWEQWLEEHRSDAFANAGHVPESRRLPYDNRFEKRMYDTGQFLRYILPGGKE